jgi:hypothetical protein
MAKAKSKVKAVVKRAKQKRQQPKSTKFLTKDKIVKFKKKYKDRPTKFMEGNSFWTMRSKHGRDAIFKDPETMWRAFVEYVQLCKENPWTKIEYKTTKRGLVKVEIPTAQPITMIGFAGYCGVWEQYFRDFKNSVTYASNSDFARVINEITNLTKNQNINGALTGTFNANLTSRLYGLAENVNNNVDDQRKEVGDLFPSKLKVPNQ